MVSYNDLGSVPFWKALEAGECFEGRTENPEHAADSRPPGARLLSGRRGAGAAHAFQISREMVQTAQEQVKEVHGLKFVPEPYTAVYHDWGEDPYGAGWHAWKAGEKFWEIMPYMRGIPGENVHICGEAYSIGQGWVEGALQTAELMLKEHFGLRRPGFIPRRLLRDGDGAVKAAAKARRDASRRHGHGRLQRRPLSRHPAGADGRGAPVRRPRRLRGRTS